MSDETAKPDRQQANHEQAQAEACTAISPRYAKHYGTPEECRAAQAWEADV